jgi:Acetyltransferase (GNAT) domain
MSKKKYYEKFNQAQVSFDELPDSRKGFIAHIETDRFHATSINVKNNPSTFQDLPNNLKKLYEVTFADSQVMEKFATGKTLTPEIFLARMKMQSDRSEKGYPFVGFVVENPENDDVLGYEVIGNGFDSDDKPMPNTGELAYLFNKDYHRGGSKGLQDVGYECAGGLVVGYGEKLYNEKRKVNQSFNEATDEFENGTDFFIVTATSRTDNLGSARILEKLGFDYIGVNEKFGRGRFVFEKDYSIEEDFGIEAIGNNSNNQTFESEQ